jgi:diaminopimelate epimerase
VTEPGFADGVNVEFVADRGERHIAMRVHERGVGETRSCGTGACAAMAAAAKRAGEGGATSYVVDVPGGRLTVSRRADGQVELTGPAVLVAEGVLRGDWLAAHR